eukprot:CAMPEP_0172812822 /NCGR_PEP_ID=MMETSP1075-20121228/10276_1 /TAXON_ID=2916 /ORGANISM="Ceratium fusus, Strain PA161109" /LENGTH=61 /DNA_ID=CAMNT_0013652421 /DNA_START=918 /DNA_END=1103 /DNA_ORIENTATION=+
MSLKGDALAPRPTSAWGLKGERANGKPGCPLTSSSPGDTIGVAMFAIVSSLMGISTSSASG